MSAEGIGNKSRVFIVDDHPLVREWLTKLINQQPDLIAVGEAESGSEARKAIVALKPDVTIVDISLKESSGLDLVKDLRLSCPAVAVLVLSMHEESYYARRALLAGAKGYIMKRETTKKIISAIHQVLLGKLFVSESIAALLVEHFVANRKPGPHFTVDTLSDRERQVFEFLGQGCGTRQIGERLGITIKTVQAYCTRIKDKLHVESATELLREAVRFHDNTDKT